MPTNTPQSSWPCATEMPVELFCDGNKITTFLCTPENLADLAAGHLVVRGMLPAFADILSVTVDESRWRILVTTRCGVGKGLYSVPEFVLSGCSSVASFNDNIYRLKKEPSPYRISLSELVCAATQMVDGAAIYKRTGGVHGAALLCRQGIFIREDIGRHNAVDKVIGAGLKYSVDLSLAAIATTGRISLDMLLKAAAVGIPVVASMKYPSDLGIRLAECYDTCIVGRILSPQPLVYTSAWRIDGSLPEPIKKEDTSYVR